MTEFDALIQHFNPACRAARKYPELAVSRLLISLNDYDLPAHALKQRKSFLEYFGGNILLPIAFLIQLTLILLPESVQEGLFETVVVGAVNFTIVAFTVVESINFAIMIALVVIIVCGISYREMQLERRRRRRHSKAIMPVDVDNVVDGDLDKEIKETLAYSDRGAQREGTPEEDELDKRPSDTSNVEDGVVVKPRNRWSYRKSWFPLSGSPLRYRITNQPAWLSGVSLIQSDLEKSKYRDERYVPDEESVNIVQQRHASFSSLADLIHEVEHKRPVGPVMNPSEMLKADDESKTDPDEVDAEHEQPQPSSPHSPQSPSYKPGVAWGGSRTMKEEADQFIPPDTLREEDDSFLPKLSASGSPTSQTPTNTSPIVSPPSIRTLKLKSIKSIDDIDFEKVGTIGDDLLTRRTRDEVGFSPSPYIYDTASKKTAADVTSTPNTHKAISTERNTTLSPISIPPRSQPVSKTMEEILEDVKARKPSPVSRVISRFQSKLTPSSSGQLGAVSPIANIYLNFDEYLPESVRAEKPLSDARTPALADSVSGYADPGTSQSTSAFPSPVGSLRIGENSIRSPRKLPPLHTPPRLPDPPLDRKSENEIVASLIKGAENVGETDDKDRAGGGGAAGGGVPRQASKSILSIFKELASDDF
jgi:hypothetical protein